MTDIWFGLCDRLGTTCAFGFAHSVALVSPLASIVCILCHNELTHLPAGIPRDMLDEFVYQFQSFAQWRSSVKNKSEDELAMLAENPQVCKTPGFPADHIQN